MNSKRMCPGDCATKHAADRSITDALHRAMNIFPAEWAAAAGRPITADITDHLANVSPGTYDHRATALLAAASAWAYSENEEVIRMLDHQGFSNTCVTVRFENQGFLMDSLVHVIQSKDGRVAILVFRGSQLQPLINWLANINVSPEPFFAAGRVHGGFHAGILSVWQRIRLYLMAAKNGEAICNAWHRDILDRSCDPECARQDICTPHFGAPSLSRQDAQDPEMGRLRRVMDALGEGLRFKLEALYLTGHSLGGALAVLAAALIYWQEDLRDLRPLLRGIYTFGQPMVGDPDFAREFDGKFGNKLFRHVHSRDVMPHLPPTTAGTFAHFGQEYRWAPTGWTRHAGPIASQARLGGLALLGSLANWFADQFALKPSRPSPPTPMACFLDQLMPKLVPSILREPLGYSLTDHMPIHYVRASRAVIPGSEFL